VLTLERPIFSGACALPSCLWVEVHEEANTQGAVLRSGAQDVSTFQKVAPVVVVVVVVVVGVVSIDIRPLCICLEGGAHLCPSPIPAHTLQPDLCGFILQTKKK